VARGDSHYCSIHTEQEKKPSKFPIVLGVAAGHLVAPGLGGMIVGGLIGSAFVKEKKMNKTRVFVSFDYDHDAGLKAMLIGQSRNTDTPFEIADWSVKEHLTGDWKAKARTRMRQTDQAIILCGQHTHTAAGVSAELKIAQEEGKPYFLLWGYKEKRCTKPLAAKASDEIYNWTWPNLKNLIGGSR
jgi:hypothetical protein